MSFNRVLGGGFALATHVVPRAADSPESPSADTTPVVASSVDRPYAPPIKRSPEIHRLSSFSIRRDQNHALDLAVAIRDWRYGRNRSDIVERALDAIGYNVTYLESFQSEG